jgi:hypothetical protein
MNYTFGPAAGTLVFNEYKLVFDWTYNSLYFYTGESKGLNPAIKDTEENKWITIELGKFNMLEIVNKEYFGIFMQMCKKIYNESIIHPYESVRRNRILLNDLIDYKIK